MLFSAKSISLFAVMFLSLAPSIGQAFGEPPDPFQQEEKPWPSGKASPVAARFRKDSRNYELEKAVVAHTPVVDYVEASFLEVTQVLPDANYRNSHQRWIVRTANGKIVYLDYNLDLCPRVPLKVGDRIAIGGEFRWTERGPLVHWLHYDPIKKRPSGYVQHHGTKYCSER